MVESHEVENELLRNSSPVVTAPDVAEALGCSGEHVRQHLRALEAAGTVESKKAGARARVYWHEERTDKEDE